MTREPKKSDMLEVRLSHEDKEALKGKAADEGSSVSAVVRRLIGDYLSVSEPPRSLRTRVYNMPRNLSFAALATATIACGALLLHSPDAHADEYKLAMSLQYAAPVVENGESGLRTTRAETEVHMSEEGVVCLTVEQGVECDPATMSADGLAVVVFASPDPSGVKISLQIKDKQDVLSEPSIVIARGETGSIQISNKDGSHFAFDVTDLAKL